MKKFLIATTALTLAAGAASAQQVSTASGSLSITGQGFLGVQHTKVGGAAATRNIDQRFQLNFQITKETDAGVTFGAYTRVRLEDRPNGGAAPNTVFSGSRVWVQAAGVRFTVGNQDGAIATSGVSHGFLGGCGIGYEGGQQCADTVGLLGTAQRFNSTGHSTVNTRGNDDLIKVDYTIGTTSLALSHERGTNGATEVGVRHRFGDFTVAGGLARGGLVDITTLSGNWSANGYSVGVLFARLDGAPVGGRHNNAAITASANFGPSTVYGFVGRERGENNFGLNYSYDLGGARLIVGGERTGWNRTTTASAGVLFTF